MTPALTPERHAAGSRPDDRQRLLIALVRDRDAARTTRQLESWVHRRGLASLQAFRRDAVPGLLSAADDAWLEGCLQEPLERRQLQADAPVPATPIAMEAEPPLAIRSPQRAHGAGLEGLAESGQPLQDEGEPQAAAAIHTESGPALQDATAAIAGPDGPWTRDACRDQGAWDAFGEPPASEKPESLAAPPIAETIVTAEILPTAWAETASEPSDGLESTEPPLPAPSRQLGHEPGHSAVGVVLADAPQRLRRKLFGSLGKARVLMRACFEEAISTLHSHDAADPEGEPASMAVKPAPAVAGADALMVSSWPGLDGSAAAAQPASPAGPPSAALEPDPIGAAPLAAWSRSLASALPAAASLDVPLQGPPAPAPAHLADLRAWLPGSANHDRRAS